MAVAFDDRSMRLPAALRKLPTTRVLLVLSLALAASAVVVAVWG